MKPFKVYIDSVLEIWNDATPAARIGIALLATICITAIGGVGYWSAQPNYVSLISDADGEKMDKVIDALDKAGIKFDLSGAGGNLRVDSRDYSKARLIARGKGVTTDQAADFGMGGAFGSPSERKNIARQKLQLSLANTIKKLNVVEQADVHLNVPDKGPFERKTSPPSASVMVTLALGRGLSDTQASSIASIVAFAVEDLDPEAVRITDKEGRMYQVPDAQAHHISSQIEFTTESERKLGRKAQNQLVHFLGQGNASVEVTLDLTFTSGSKVTTKYDSEGKVPTTEDLNTETTTNSSPIAVGAAGVDANLQSRRGGAGAKDVQSKTESIKTSYLVPKTEETQTNTTPIRNFMTVSVLINSSAEGIQQADGTLLPGIQEQVQGMVENAVGFKQGVDAISVEFLPFPEIDTTIESIAPPFNWDQLNEIVRNVSLAVAAIVALLISFLVLKKIKPDPANSESVVRLNSDRTNSINQLAELVKTNPEVFNQIIQSWSDAGTDTNQDSTDMPARKAA